VRRTRDGGLEEEVWTRMASTPAARADGSAGSKTETLVGQSDPWEMVAAATLNDRTDRAGADAGVRARPGSPD
jgi:hypothetical protein